MQKNFSEQYLAGQSFAKQDLRDASFRNARLAGADFSGADVRGVDFASADLRCARFCGARLGRTRWPATVLHLGVCAICGVVTLVSILLNAFLLRSAASPESPADRFTGISFLVAWAAGMLLVAVKGLSPGTFRILGALSAAILVTNAVAGLLGYSTAAVAAVWMAIAIAVAMAVTGVGAAAGAIAGAFVAVFLTALGGAMAFGGEGVRVLTQMAEVAVAAQFAFAIFIRWRLSVRDPKFSQTERARARFLSADGTWFEGADLTNANFEDADLSGACFADADITRVRWRGADRIHESRFGGSILTNRRAERLLTTGETGGEPYDDLDLHGANLDGFDLPRVSLRNANLAGASLRGTNLTAANLAGANCSGTDFTGACLTGACLEGWSINEETVLDEVECRFVFLRETDDESGNRERRPPSPGADFQPGEFIKLVRPESR